MFSLHYQIKRQICWTKSNKIQGGKTCIYIWIVNKFHLIIYFLGLYSRNFVFYVDTILSKNNFYISNYSGFTRIGNTGVLLLDIFPQILNTQFYLIVWSLGYVVVTPHRAVTTHRVRRHSAFTNQIFNRKESQF